MSIGLPKNQALINAIIKELDRPGSGYHFAGQSMDNYVGSFKVYYDASYFSRNDYVLEVNMPMDRPVGGRVSKIKSMLRKLGCTNFHTGTLKAAARKCVEICFDEDAKQKTASQKEQNLI